MVTELAMACCLQDELLVHVQPMVTAFVTCCTGSANLTWACRGGKCAEAVSLRCVGQPQLRLQIQQAGARAAARAVVQQELAQNTCSSRVYAIVNTWPES